MNMLRTRVLESFSDKKYPVLITVGFFLVTTCISLFYHNFWTIFDGDGLIYLAGGRQIIAGVGENVAFLNAGPAGPVLFASLESVFKDSLFSTKIVSILSGTGIVFFSYMVFKNIFSAKIAIVGQLFVAFNPWIGILSISSVNDLFPIFMSVSSLYFITKKDIKLTDVIFSGAILGIGFMFRYQPIIFLLAIIIFLILLKKNPKFKISAVGLLIVLFVLCCSPMLLYNYTVHDKIIDSNSNYYLSSHAKYYTQEWKDLLLDNMGKNSGVIFSNYDLFIKNYLYNLFYGQPSNLFGFENKVSASLIPAIPILGAIPVLGGLIYSLKIPASKKTFITILSTATITTALVFLLGDFNDHFFAIIIIPLIILGLQNIQKVDKKFLLLIIIAVIFSIIMAHLPLRSYKHFIYLWVFLAPLCSIFFVSVIPKLIFKIQNSESSTKILQNQKSSKAIILITISLILLVNLGYSYVTLEVITTGNSVDTVIENLNSPFTEKINPNKYDLDNITAILGSQHDIENSYIMSDYPHFAEIVGAKTEAVLFTEGPEGDSIDNYITRKNWKNWQIYFSNINSAPIDIHDLNHPMPDYLIYSNPKSFHHESLKILVEPTNPKIPKNFELLYKSPYSVTTVYKIKHDN